MGFFSSAVKELTSKDFDPVATWKLAPNKKLGNCAIVMYYAPWCPHCQETKSVWNELASVAKFFNVYAVDSQKQAAHIDKINQDMPNLIKGFPTIIIYKKGEPVETYRGERNIKDLLHKIMKACAL